MDTRRLRGAALTRAARPDGICFSAPSDQRMSQRAAPANNPSRCIYPWLPIRLYPDHRAANRWVVPGSRLFSHVAARLVMRRNLRGWPDTLQSGSPPGAGQSSVASTHRGFENEDDRPMLASLWRHCRGHHYGVSHPVHDLFIGRNNRRQNAP